MEFSSQEKMKKGHIELLDFSSNIVSNKHGLCEQELLLFDTVEAGCQPIENNENLELEFPGA